ncbi:H-type lectin domain-containing protein [Octadecabacter antarcticus]|nr:H-type lectin domain-containing protein [Octadecabacter antarcticus]
MQVITASDELFNHVDENLFMWSGSGSRSVSINIVFLIGFRETPAITLGITGIDSDCTNNLRFVLNVTEVKATEFTMEFKTWERTHIARASVSWQAIGAITLPEPTLPVGGYYA